ncbi:MAG: tetratricopeptide repeat protein, partial [Terrimicrobiaceae bacterium]|nr:tetratricopeptide repeat protein [Terrimicrobiaceae bacterium]
MKKFIRELDIHREALASALEENRALVRKLRQAAAPRRLPKFAAAAAMLLLAAAAAWFALDQPQPPASDEDFQRLSELETKNAALAAQLDSALERLREEAAKNEKPAPAFESSLLEPPAFDTSSAVALARITQLQSDLDMAQARMQRLLREMSARDLRIMELEALLAEAGGRAFHMQMPPPLTDWEAPLPSSLSTFPELIEVPPPSASDPAEDPMRSVQRRAEEAYKARNYELAETLFKTVAGSEPSNALILSNLAAVQLELGRLDEAEANIRKAIALRPEDAYSLTTLGIIQIKRGEPQAAVETLLKSVALDSTDPEAFNYLGVAFGETGLRQKAIEEIRKALALSPNYTEARFNLAVLLARGTSEEKAEARREYQHALSLGAEP